MAAGRWVEGSPSAYPWEREALEYIRNGLPDADPYRAWSNVEFVSDDGRVYEVDLVVVSPVGVFLVEIKSYPGTITGDAGTWAWHRPDGSVGMMDNPYRLANDKARKLKGLLQRQHGMRGVRIPFVQAVVFLSNPDVTIRLHPAHLPLGPGGHRRGTQAPGRRCPP